jgi:hypothetical protein
MHRVTATSSRFVQLVLLAALTAGGCAYQSRTEPVPPELLMRTYNVRRDQSDAAVTALTAALQGAPKGSRVEQLSDGRVLLVAPAEVHAGVDALVRGLDANKPIRAAELDYWVVLGEPAAAPAGLGNLQEIAAALQGIVASQGPMKFTLLETSRLSSMLDQAASAQGNLVQVRQVVSVVAGVPIADVALELRLDLGGQVYHRNLESRVNLKPGELQLVGQSGYARDTRIAEQGPHSTVFYILRGAVTRGD